MLNSNLIFLYCLLSAVLLLYMYKYIAIVTYSLKN